jgi:hypothetical protein
MAVSNLSNLSPLEVGSLGQDGDFPMSMRENFLLTATGIPTKSLGLSSCVAG